MRRIQTLFWFVMSLIPKEMVKTCARLEIKEWAFLVVSSLNILTVMGLTVYRLVIVVENEPDSSDFTFVILLLVNAVFCLFYAIYGVFFEKKFELYALIAAIFVVGMYCVLEYFVFNRRHQTIIKMMRLIVFLIMAPINITLAYLVSKDFRFLNFNTVGAFEVNQRMYSQTSMFASLLKFDLQAACSVVTLALKDGTDLSMLEISSLIICFLFSILWAIFGWFMVKKKLKGGAILFAVVGLIKPAYYLYKIIKEYMNVNDDTVPTNNTVVYSLIAAVTISLTVWLILMVDLSFIIRNMDITHSNNPDIDYHQGQNETAIVESDEHTSLLNGSSFPNYGKEIQ